MRHRLLNIGIRIVFGNQGHCKLEMTEGEIHTEKDIHNVWNSYYLYTVKTKGGQNDS